jgi:hypothetical protein
VGLAGRPLAATPGPQVRPDRSCPPECRPGCRANRRACGQRRLVRLGSCYSALLGSRRQHIRLAIREYYPPRRVVRCQDRGRQGLTMCGRGRDLRDGINLITIGSRRQPGGDRPANQSSIKLTGGNVNKSRAADDFATIRARMEELRRERERADAAGNDLLSDQPFGRGRTERRNSGEIGATPGRVRQSASPRG